jgi:hypothetical protein
MINRISAWTALVAALALAACASSPTPPASSTAAASPTPATSTTSPASPAEPATAAAEKPVPAGQTRYKWSKATEADVAAALDKKFMEASKQFVKLKRNDEVMFCKRYRDMGSNIPTLHCITEAELRRQVEDSDEIRQQMRNRMGKCDIAAGCRAGF